ncbi:predicted protein [Arabidopsis lyrata subsp. lyrata]|uniref:Predicted protein n=1 Tax=Arabidopsis lyrata subsp. lyrata TaxID=81972 RepID=D7MI45_ARALL|nr:predicted protein [Arabidopsis lyrata subsp. lyrata]
MANPKHNQKNGFPAKSHHKKSIAGEDPDTDDCFSHGFEGPTSSLFVTPTSRGAAKYAVDHHLYDPPLLRYINCISGRIHRFLHSVDLPLQ